MLYMPQLIKYAASEVTHATSTNHWSKGPNHREWGCCPRGEKTLQCHPGGDRNEIIRKATLVCIVPDAVLIFYCCITICYQLSYLKQLSFISSQFCRAEVWVSLVSFCAQDIIKSKSGLSWALVCRAGGKEPLLSLFRSWIEFSSLHL